MTPLARELAKQLLLPVRERSPFWRDNADTLRAILTDTHFFEVTAVLGLVDVVHQTSQDWFDARTFLPAPRIWIEWDNPAFGRSAVFMADRGDGWADCHLFWPEAACRAGKASYNGDYDVPPHQLLIPDPVLAAFGPKAKNLPEIYICTAHHLLVIINSPNIVGRTTLLPHRGLERNLKNRFPEFGEYPLHAWNELKLEVNLRHHDEQSGDVEEAHLTGKKCLHFCRAHLRVRLGKLELVSSHWRGDPSLGIRRTRYKVVPEHETIS